VIRHYGYLAKERWPASRIARELGRSEACVRAQARDFGCFIRPRTCRLNTRLAQRLHQEGHTDQHIAWRCEVDVRTVRRWRAVKGLPANRKKRTSGYQAARERLLAMTCEGKARRAMAFELGVGLGTIVRWLRLLAEEVPPTGSPHKDTA
jgi:transposase